MRSTLLRMRVHAHSFQAPRPALQVLPFAASFQESSHPKDDKDISYRVQQAAPWEWWLSQTVSGGGTLVLSWALPPHPCCWGSSVTVPSHSLGWDSAVVHSCWRRGFPGCGPDFVRNLEDTGLMLVALHTFGFLPPLYFGVGKVVKLRAKLEAFRAASQSVPQILHQWWLLLYRKEKAQFRVAHIQRIFY